MAEYKNNHKPYGPYERFFKRPLDFIFALLALIILSPILLVVAILVRIKLGSPIIFKQERPGKDEKIFKLYKFRTMTDAKDKKGKLLPNEKRITKFGKILRATSLDELPELINILKGEMSFVGPRPLHIEYLKYYNKQQKTRHNVRPGLTGWAQVNGRNSISWTEKFKLDTYYVKNISFVMDIKVILLTIKKVFVREGINAANGQFTERFNGSN